MTITAIVLLTAGAAHGDVFVAPGGPGGTFTTRQLGQLLRDAALVTYSPPPGPHDRVPAPTAR